MRGALRSVAAIVWLAALTCGAGAGDGWTTYVNDRFGAHIAYPADVFAMQPPPGNDDGRTLTAADGAEILVFSGYNIDNQTLADKRASLTGPDYTAVSYRAAGKNWFVVSGHRAVDGVDTIFYEKYIVSVASDEIHSLIVTYPAALRARYDPIVAKVAASFGGP